MENDKSEINFEDIKYKAKYVTIRVYQNGYTLNFNDFYRSVDDADSKLNCPELFVAKSLEELNRILNNYLFPLKIKE